MNFLSPTLENIKYNKCIEYMFKLYIEYLTSRRLSELFQSTIEGKYFLPKNILKCSKMYICSHDVIVILK